MSSSDFDPNSNQYETFNQNPQQFQWEPAFQNNQEQPQQFQPFNNETFSPPPPPPPPPPAPPAPPNPHYPGPNEKSPKSYTAIVVGLLVAIAVLIALITFLFLKLSERDTNETVLVDLPPVAQETEPEITETKQPATDVPTVEPTQTPEPTKEDDSLRKAQEATQLALDRANMTATAEAIKLKAKSDYTEAEKSLSNSAGYWAQYKGQQWSKYNSGNPYFNTRVTTSKPKHFMLMVNFSNPPALSKDEVWEVGVVFRHVNNENFLILSISSEGGWRLENCKDRDYDCTLINSGDLRVNKEPSESNILKLMVFGNIGHFYYSGQYFSDLDLSSRTNEGAVFVFTKFNDGTVRDGYSIHYKNLSLKVVN